MNKTFQRTFQYKSKSHMRILPWHRLINRRLKSKARTVYLHHKAERATKYKWTTLSRHFNYTLLSACTEWMYFIIRKELLKLACLQFNSCRRLLSTTHLKSSLQNLTTVIPKLTRTLLQKVCEIIQQLKNRITGVSSVLEENNILSRRK